MAKLNPQLQIIAATLGETQARPLGLLKRAWTVLGPERIQALVEETLQLEAEGGLLITSGPRRRTPGGVFFKLLRDKTTSAERQAIFSPQKKGQKRNRLAAGPPTPEEIQQAITIVLNH